MRSYFTAGLTALLSLASGVNSQTPENCLNARALEKVVTGERDHVWMAGCSLDDSDWPAIMAFLNSMGDKRADMKKLNLSHNSFTYVPGKLLKGFGSKLEYLSLNSNELESLPKNLFKHAGVGDNPNFWFMANINNLTTLHSKLFRGKVGEFQWLELRHNNLSNLPDNLFSGTKIDRLKIDGNPELSCLPRQAGEYRKRQTDGGVPDC